MIIAGGGVIHSEATHALSHFAAKTGRVRTYDELSSAIHDCRKQEKVSVVVVETEYHDRVPGYESWWDVALAEVSEMQNVNEAFERYEQAKRKERCFWPAKN